MKLGNDYEGEEGLVLVTRKTLLSPKVEKDSEWLTATFSTPLALSKTEFVI